MWRNVVKALYKQSSPTMHPICVHSRDKPTRVDYLLAFERIFILIYFPP
jgi:hypothetical protein